jgi:hypothetical protein
MSPGGDGGSVHRRPRAPDPRHRMPSPAWASANVLLARLAGDHTIHRTVYRFFSCETCDLLQCGRGGIRGPAGPVQTESATSRRVVRIIRRMSSAAPASTRMRRVPHNHGDAVSCAALNAAAPL